MRQLLLLVAVLAVSLLGVATAHALDRTPNMVMLQDVATDDYGIYDDYDYGYGAEEERYPVSLLGEYRIFNDEDRRIWAAGFQSVIEPGTEVVGWYVNWQTQSEDPIGVALRESQWESFSMTFVKELTNPESSLRIAIAPTIDLATDRIEGVNLATGASARQRSVHPGIAALIQGSFGSTKWVIEPKAVWFRDTLPTSTGGTIPGFDTVVTVGAGVAFPFFGGEIIADASVPVSGDNTIDEATNQVDTTVVWGAGWRRNFGSMDLSVFATNAAGPTLATSVIGAVSDDIGVGARAGFTFK